LIISKGDLMKIGFFPSFFKHGKDLIDNEFHHSFLCELKVPLESLQKQESEVESLSLIPIGQFMEELNDNDLRQKYVPYEMEHYNSIIKKVVKKL